MHPSELSAQAEATIEQGKRLIASNLPEATRLLNEAVRLFWASGDQYRAVAEIGNYGWALRRMGRPDLAQTYLVNAADLFDQLGLTDFATRHRAAAENSDDPLTPEVLAGFPSAVRTALEQGDAEGLQAAIDALPPFEQTLVYNRLQEAGLVSDTTPDATEEALLQFAPLLEAIAAVAKGAESERADVLLALEDLERKGWRLRKAVLRLWQGERKPKRLFYELDEIDQALIKRAIELIDGANPE